MSKYIVMDPTRWAGQYEASWCESLEEAKYDRSHRGKDHVIYKLVEVSVNELLGIEEEEQGKQHGE